MQENTFYITQEIYASKNQRFCNYLVYFIVQYLLAFIILIIAAVIAGFFGYNGVGDWIAEMNRLEQYLLGIIVTLAYYLPFEIFMSRTVGKFITNTEVVMIDGSKPDAAAIIKRTLCRCIPFDWISFLGGRGWHDSMSDTFVVKKQAKTRAMELHYAFDEIGQAGAGNE